MSPAGPTRLGRFLASCEHVLVVRDDGVAAEELTSLGRFVGRATCERLSKLTPGFSRGAPEQPDAVVLVVADRLALRRSVGAVQTLPSATHVVCVLMELASQPPTLVASPSWPRLTSLEVRTDRGAQVLASFAAPVATGQVFTELARRTTPAHLMAAGWPVLGARALEPHRWPPGDALAVVGADESLHDVSGDYPADVLLLDTPPGDDVARPDKPHAVTGRVQVSQVLGRHMTWEPYDRLPDADARARLGTAGPAALGPLDERVLNPIGFSRKPKLPVAQLRPLAVAPHVLHLEDAPEAVADTRRGMGDGFVAAVRSRAGIHVTWDGGEGPHAYVRTVAGLAMSGVPLTADFVPPWARALLDPTVVGLLESKPDLDDVLEREVHSIRLRRAALGTHGSVPWRRALSASTGGGVRRSRVSVLLATRRPELIEHALRQVGRQRGVDLELVLATHGFTPDPGVTDAFRERSGMALEVLSAPAEQSFGRVLNAAATRATGDVLLKMDDDDWYGPDFVSDLLLARDYSGADVVGCPPEFMFVEPLWVTVRRRDATEQYRPVVAGGTMMVSREAFQAVGGFRDTRKYVDANLFRALRAAGGTIYRTHGLDYLLRRRGGGHTWEPGLGYFVSRGRSWQQWRGFRPSPLLEHDTNDRPVRTTDGGR